ncbi:caspase family protein [Novosphingobium sp. BL-52-GroH]|uniref:caspase family protein n=1 Tax=Novosphingobium sp. BL-52-GroH TaxID=3349877 RepID=UPI00384E591A
MTKKAIEGPVWIAAKAVEGTIPAAEFVRQYAGQADHALSHYLLTGDATLIASRRPIPGNAPVDLLLLTTGDTEANPGQRKVLDELDAFLTAWNKDPATPLPSFLAQVEGSPDRFTPGSRPAPIAPRAATPAISPWPPYRDPGAFSGSPEQLRALAPHVINLRKGRLSDDGLATTSEDDLDDIVETIAARCEEGGYKLMLYAHGGLTEEKYGLAMAWAYHRWWLAHGIYPVFFVWETGGLETFWQILDGDQRRGRAISRDIWDHTTDLVVETLGRRVGTLLWQAMKDSARQASEPGGGARLFADKLAAKWTDRSEIFAVGHSAGSIFHAHLLPLLCGHNLGVEQMHFLAPAVTNALFAAQLLPLIGKGIDEATIFALSREAERADNCAGAYRKSLLYLVSRAFEGEKGTAILGMEDFQRTTEVRRAFGNRIVLAPTQPSAPADAASTSRSHGGFDNDAPTMESVLRRMLRLPPALPVVPAFPAGEPRLARAISEPNYYGVPQDLFRQGAVFQPEPAPAPAAEVPVAAAQVPGGTVRLGAQKIALCIGNNAFPDGMELYGCINDAQTWAETFRGQGFDPQIVTDARAQEIRDAIRNTLQRSRAGDSVVIHISSHGSQILDVDGDEMADNQFADTKDEALVAIDWREGGLIVDDEWPVLLTAPPGVKLIRFHDFCHSGRSSRMALAEPTRMRRRSVSLPDEIARKAYAAAPMRAGPAARAAAFGAELPYLTFCACLPHESAMEDNGSGLFTRAATRVLRGQGATLSAQDAFAAIAREMRDDPQKPLLEGSALFAGAPLFGAPS